MFKCGKEILTFSHSSLNYLNNSLNIKLNMYLRVSQLDSISPRLIPISY